MPSDGVTKPAKTHRLTLLVASSDRSYAGALAAALGVHGDIQIRGQASSANELLMLLDLDPDLVLVALPLGEVTDWDVIAKSSAQIGVLVLGPEDESTMIPALEAGATGYLTDQASFEEISQAIRSVAAGIPVVPPLMLGSLLRHVVRRRREERRSQERLRILTGRERQIFELLAGGLDKHSIAETLFISPETARTHIHNILTKLELHSQVELLTLASQCGFEIGRRDG